MKVLASIVVVILLLCGGALWFLAGGSLNQFVKAQIESVGQQVTEQKVSVSNVEISLVNGAGSILGITLPNPSGYQYPNAFTLGEATLDIDVKNISKDLIILDAIVIKDPKAFVEFSKDGRANLQDLLDIVEKNTGHAKQGKAPENNSRQTEPNIKIKKVVLAGTALSADLSALGNKEHKLTLPDITLTNIGGEDGLPASQLGGVIIKKALSKIWQQTKDVQKEQLMDQAKDKLKEKAAKKLTELFK